MVEEPLSRLEKKVAELIGATSEREEKAREFRDEVRDDFREVKEILAEHARDDADRFASHAQSLEKRVGQVYEHIDNERHRMLVRGWAAVGVVLTGLGIVIGMLVSLLPYLAHK